MNQRIQKAVDIANAYRAEHNGEIPALVIAHGKDETFTVVGTFRPDERGAGQKTRDDQKMFVSIMRIIFALKGVTSYEVVTKPEMDSATRSELQLTQEILSIFSVDKKSSKGSFFEMEEDNLIPVYNNVEIQSWFSKLLPTDYNVTLDPKTEARMFKYIDACRFTPKVAPAAVPAKDIFEEMLASLQ